MKSTNIKFNIGAEIKLHGKTYEVLNFAVDDDGDRLTLLGGWGSTEAYYDAEIQQMFRRGEAEVV